MINIKINPKFKIDDEVFLVFDAKAVLLNDDEIPVLKATVLGYTFKGAVYTNDEIDYEIGYELTLGTFDDDFIRNENTIFSTREEAVKHYSELLDKQLSKAKANLNQIESFIKLIIQTDK